MPGPWSVKGIDEETREVARAAAQAAGIPIGQWIDRAILRAAARLNDRPVALEPPPANGNAHDVAVVDTPRAEAVPPPEEPREPLPAAEALPRADAEMAPAAPPSVEEPPPAPPVEPTAGVVAPEETPAPAPETAPPEAEQPEAAAAWREPPAPVETAQPAVEPAAPEPQPPPAPPEAEPSREPAPVVTLTTGSSAAAARDRYRPVVAVEAPPPPRRRRSSHILAKIGLGLATGLLIGTLIAWLTGGAPWSERTAADRALARIQILLTELHFEPGPADGVMRPQTAEAITQFQRFAGMPADGKPGSAVLAELEAVAAASRGTPR